LFPCVLTSFPIICLFACTFSAAFAQPFHGSIRIIITDCKTGTVIDRSRAVLLETKQGTVSCPGRPNPVIRNIRPGAYTCECRAEGYASKKETITIKETLELVVKVCLLYEEHKNYDNPRYNPEIQNRTLMSRDSLARTTRDINWIFAHTPDSIKYSVSGGSDRPRAKETSIKLPDSLARLMIPANVSDTSRKGN